MTSKGPDSIETKIVIWRYKTGRGSHKELKYRVYKRVMFNTNRGWVFVAAKCQGRGAILLAKWVDKLEDFFGFPE